MNFTEQINDVKNAKYIKSLTCDDMIKLGIMKSTNTVMETQTQHTLITKYCDNMIKSNGSMDIIYKTSDNSPHGRVFGKNGIQTISGIVRGFLFNGVTTDLDFQNAHPMIALYICNKNNIHCPHLSDYCNNRKKWLQIEPDVKLTVISMLNNHKINYDNKNTQLRDLDKELKRIQSSIYNLETYKHITIKADNSKNNLIGSAFNGILCYYENRLLTDLCERLQSNHSLSICSKMFDGCMVYGDIDDNTSNAIIKDCEEYINNKWRIDDIELNIVITKKPHDTSIQIPYGWVEPINTDEDSFENVSERFELTHAKIINKSVFIKTHPDRTFSIFTEKGLRTGYSHLMCDDWIKTKEGGYTKSVGFISKWLTENPKQRRYDDFINNPYCGSVDPNEDTTLFNIWNAFDGEFIKPDTFVWKQDALDIILKHISILCNHQTEVTDYIIKWIAQMIQFPKVKSICPTLISKEGAGKGTLLLLIRKMLGDSKVMETTTPARDVWGTFNNSMANSFLVVLNEMSKKDTTDCEGIIKALITDPKITINTKGVSSYDINSYHRFIITTNNEDPITSKKDDRRNLIIRSSDELIGNKQYFNDLRELINNDDVVKTCYEYFKSIKDLDKFGNIPMPITLYQQDIKEASLSPIEVWFKDYVISNLNYVDKNGIAIKIISPSELFQSFVEYKISNDINFNINNIQFGVRLKRLNMDGLTTKSTNKGNVWVLDIKTVKHFLGLGLLIDSNL